jgi:hypothetical protein
MAKFVEVIDVQKGSQGEDLGIQKGDIYLNLNGEEVKDKKIFDCLDLKLATKRNKF